jgi:hypothetical protein
MKIQPCLWILNLDEKKSIFLMVLVVKSKKKSNILGKKNHVLAVGLRNLWKIQRKA